MNTAIIVITLTGMTLEFLSFWFVAPEILGQERLERLEGWIEKPLSLLERHHNIYFIFGGILVILVLEYIELTIVAPWVTWILTMIGAYIAGYLIGRFVPAAITKILAELSIDERIRRRAIVTGAVMFVISFFLQFTVVLLGGFTS